MAAERKKIGRAFDETGNRYGKLLVTEMAPRNDNYVRWNCICDCGAIKLAVDGGKLRDGGVKSCGCLMGGRRAETIVHDMWRTPTHNSWATMIQRATNPKVPGWHRYGGRGITVCDRWRSFVNFYADMGLRPEGKTLDRINNDGNYEPENCRWATEAEQHKNMTHRGGVPKLTPEKASDMRRMHANGDTQAYIAEIFDVSTTAVNRVINGKAWVANA